MISLLQDPRSGQALLVNGVSVALDETAREVSERQVLPAGGLRERFEQQRPITARRRAYSFWPNRPIPAQTAPNRKLRRLAYWQVARLHRRVIVHRAGSDYRATEERFKREPRGLVRGRTGRTMPAIARRPSTIIEGGSSGFAPEGHRPWHAILVGVMSASLCVPTMPGSRAGAYARWRLRLGKPYPVPPSAFALVANPRAVRRSGRPPGFR